MTASQPHWAGPLEPYLTTQNLALAASTPLVLVALYILIPFFTAHSSLRKYSGPAAAKFTRLWLALQTRRGHRSEKVHEEHEKFGSSSPASFAARSLHALTIVPV